MHTYYELVVLYARMHICESMKYIRVVCILLRLVLVYY